MTARFPKELVPSTHFLDRVAWYLAHDIGTPEPEPGHTADQRAAATTEASRIATDLDPGIGPVADESTPTDLAVCKAAVAAVLDRMRMCPHLDAPQPVFVRMDLNRGDCGRCARTIDRAHAVPLGHCTMCLAPAPILEQMTLQMASIILTGPICEVCQALLPTPGEFAGTLPVDAVDSGDDPRP